MHLIINFLIYFLVFTNSTLSLSPSQRHGVMGLSLSLSHSRLSLSFLLFFLFFLHFWLFYLVLGSYWLLGFLLFFFFFFYFLKIYIFFKVFMGSWKLLGWLTGIGIGEVRGPELKTKGPKLFLWKFYILKKKKILDPGWARAPFALCLGSSLIARHQCSKKILFQNTP